MMTTLGYALLGLLARQPCSGYDLAQKIKKPVGLFWHARHSQIYPELGRLEAQGMVTHHVVEQTERPDKKIYAISDQGIAALRVWVNAPLPVTPRRDEFMLKAFSLWLAEPQRAIALLREHATAHDEQCARYEAIQKSVILQQDTTLRPDSPEFARYIVIQRGIGYEREYAAWCAWVADLLEHAAEV